MHRAWAAGVLLLCYGTLRPVAAVGRKGPDGKDETSLVSLQADGYALNVTVVPAGSYEGPEVGSKEERRDQLVVSSWAMVALTDYQGSISQKEFPWLAQGIQHAVADSIGVCRSAVTVVDMRAANVNFVIEPVRKQRAHAQHSLVHRIQQLMRSSKADEDPLGGRLNITRVKAVYEVRIFDQMRVPAPEVARRIDRLQIFTKFSDLSRALTRALAQRATADVAESIMLDDVGYASRRVLQRSPLSQGALSDCVEEALLHDARVAHQYFVAAALFLVALITCVGSSVFTIKHPSTVPSRMNPLLGPSPT